MVTVRESPRIAVITPCYNHELYLDDYFQGLLNQTYANVELIIFDDGSTDGSWSKIEHYLPQLRGRFPRVVAERHENLGFHRELALGLEAVTGEFTCILESDDYYYPTKIEENVRLLQSHPELGVIHSDFDRLRQRSWQRACQRSIRDPIPSDDVLADLLEGNYISTPTSCVRTDLLRKHVDFVDFQQRGYSLADYPMWLRLARVCRFGYIDKPLACYRVLDESASHSRCSHRRYQFFKSIEQVLVDFAVEFDTPPAVKERILRGYHFTRYYGGYALMQKSDCQQGYRWLLEHYPAEFATWKQRLRMTIVEKPWLWKAVRRFESIPLAKKLFGEYQLPK